LEPAADAVALSAPTDTQPLRSTLVAWDSLNLNETPVGLYSAIFNAPTATLEKLELHVTTLRPGMATHAPHHHPWEEIFLIKAGVVDISINGEKRRGGPGALIFIAPHDVHNLTNVGETAATYYVITYTTASVHTVRSDPAASWEPATLLHSSLIDCDAVPPVPTATGSRRGIVDSPTATLVRLESHITTLNVGDATPPDLRGPADELVIMRSGTVDATANGASSRLGPGSLAFIASGDPHAFRNAGTVEASYQVIKLVSDRTPAH
jgi:quercetin dioxygenase-like cupin family protein